MIVFLLLHIFDQGIFHQARLAQKHCRKTTDLSLRFLDTQTWSIITKTSEQNFHYPSIHCLHLKFQINPIHIYPNRLKMSTCKEDRIIEVTSEKMTWLCSFINTTVVKIFSLTTGTKRRCFPLFNSLLFLGKQIQLSNLLTLFSVVNLVTGRSSDFHLLCSLYHWQHLFQVFLLFHLPFFLQVHQRHKNPFSQINSIYHLSFTSSKALL